jgi:hypothetical protein
MLPLKTGNAIADSGAMQIFVIENLGNYQEGNCKPPNSVLCGWPPSSVDTYVQRTHQGLPLPINRTHYPQSFHCILIRHTRFDRSGM